MHSNRLAGETETFVRVGVTSRLELGFGYLWRPNVVRPLGSYTLINERGDRPSLTGGVFVDSLGGGRNAFFVSAARNLRSLGIPAGVYAGGARITNERGARFVAGANVALGRSWAASVQYDGRDPHYGLTTRLGSTGGLPIRVGLVLSEGRFRALGPMAATQFPVF